MRLFFSLFSLLFYFISFPSQAQVLMKYQVYQNMDQFDWLGFVNEENVRKHVDFTNQAFQDLGGQFIITRLKLDKLQLLRIEQELELYREGIKEGLSSDEIKLAKRTIDRHWNNIMNIERQIQAQAGFRVSMEKVGYSVGTPTRVDRHLEKSEVATYRDTVRVLYEGDYEVLLSIVEKENQNLYSSLAYNDEFFATLVLPQVEQYITKMGDIASFYHNALLSLDQGIVSEFDEDTIDTLMRIYYNSLEVYKCFLENFPNPVGESQERLKQIIESWYERQGVWGTKALMKAYKYRIRDNPWEVARSFHDFKTLPLEEKIKIAEFYRNEFLYNRDFIHTDDLYKQGARTDALIGLKLFELLEDQELALFNRAIEEGSINNFGGSFSASIKPLPTLL